MAPTLYMIPGSPPVRAVLMVAKAIKLDLTLKPVNILAGEQLTPEYKELNPQHTVPTLVDEDGFTVWDSHAIIAYLVSKYGKDDTLYPKDLQKRAVIDQRLHFDTGVLFNRLGAIVRPVALEGIKEIAQASKDKVQEAYVFVEAFLSKTKWAAGDNVTIADYSWISTISTLELLVPIAEEKFPKLVNWRNRVKALPAYEANKEGLQSFKEIWESKMKK